MYKYIPKINMNSIVFIVCDQKKRRGKKNTFLFKELIEYTYYNIIRTNIYFNI